MPVTTTSYTTCGSGGHAHDASCNDGRPQALLSLVGTPISSTISGLTDSTGCVDFDTLMPEFAGYVTVRADNANYLTTIVTPAGAIVANYPASTQGENFFLQDYGAAAGGRAYQSTDPTNPIPYPAYAYNSALNDINYEPLDYQHGNNINNAMPTTISEVTAASSAYMDESEEYLGYQDQIIIWRMSLPWGGIADNGVKQTITSFDYPAWDATTPFNAGNPYGYEVEITNPSFSPTVPPGDGIQDEAGAMYAIWVFAKNGCYMGVYQPSFDENVSDNQMQGAAIEQFWITQQTIHFECGYSERKAGSR